MADAGKATGFTALLPPALQDNPYFGAGFGLTLLGVGLAMARRSAALLQVRWWSFLCFASNVTKKKKWSNMCATGCRTQALHNHTRGDQQGSELSMGTVLAACTVGTLALHHAAARKVRPSQCRLAYTQTLTPSQCRDVLAQARQRRPAHLV